MTEFKVGLITLAAILSTVIVSLQITSNDPSFGDYVAYRTIINDASGIYEKTPIKVAGINSGRILSVELQGTQALIRFEVIEDVKITKNSVLRIKTVGFLGDKYLDIFLGEPTDKRLAPDSLVPSHTGGGLEDISKDAGEVLTEVKEIAKKIKESLVDENKQNVLKKIVKNIHEVTENVKVISQTLRKNDSNLDRIMKNLAKTSEQLAYETDRAETGSAMADVAPMLQDARNAMKDLKEIIADVKAGKGTVGKLLRDEEVVDQVSQTLSGVNRLVGRINNIEAELGLYSGINSDNGSDTRFNVDLYPGPERFYRIGIITNDYGPQVKDEKTITSTTGGSSTTTEYREIDTDAIKFNLQLGRRVQRWGFRVGIIETTGGVGIDYHLPDYGIKFAGELFDYQEEVGPNLRLITELRLWGVVYTRIAGEDLISDNSNQSLTVSLGLRFTDQDLAALLGVLAN